MTLNFAHNRLIISLLAVFMLSACIERQDENTYSRGEVGLSKAVEFGTVVSMRDVKIMTEDKYVEDSTLAGAGVGAGAGAYTGNGSGSLWAAAGGAVAGGLLGHEISKELGQSDGIEFTLQMRNGDTKTIVLDKSDDNKLLKAGDKVMLQYCDANDHNYRCKPEKNGDKEFQRIFKVDKFPPAPKKKKRSRRTKTGDTYDDYINDH